MNIGGVSGWLRAADLAHSRNILLSYYLWPEISAQLLCLTPTAHWLEYADWWNPILAQPLQINNGLTTTDGMTGTGVDWNEEAIKKYAV